MNFGRCSICTLTFDITDIAALKCGHTFHNQCIDRWITNSKTCPNCRTTNLKRDICRLYFDEPDKSFSQSTQDTSHLVNDKELMNELKEMKDAKFALECNLQEHKEQIASLDRQLRREKTKTAQLQTKDQHIKHLESQLFEQGVLKEKAEKYRRRLEASEFYNLLMRSTSNGDSEAIDKYLNQHGNVDDAKFFKLMRSRYDEEVKKSKVLTQDLRIKDKQLRELHKEIGQLRKELDGSKRRKIEEITKANESLSSSKQNRRSFGFSFTEPGDSGEVMQAAKNFAFANDSSIEIISAPEQQPTGSKFLDQFDPISNKKSTKYTKEDGKKGYLPDELAEVFSPNFLSHARKANH